MPLSGSTQNIPIVRCRRHSPQEIMIAIPRASSHVLTSNIVFTGRFIHRGCLFLFVYFVLAHLKGREGSHDSLSQQL